MASPVFTPGGQCSVRKPHNSTIPADAVLKLEIQMLSLPSTEAAHGPTMPLPYTGENGCFRPVGTQHGNAAPFVARFLLGHGRHQNLGRSLLRRRGRCRS